MKTRWIALVALAVMMVAPAACERKPKAEVSTPPPPPSEPTADVGAEIQPLLKDLGPGVRRVKVFVLPGDAEVESGDVPIRRRNGLVELTGKVGDTRLLRVSKGRKYIEEKVTITDQGAEPARIEFKEKTAKSSEDGVEPEPDDTPKVFFYRRRH